MAKNLSWADLFEDISPEQLREILLCWPGRVTGRVRPIGMSAFGDCYFARESGGVYVLDTLEGGVRVVASSESEFATNMNDGRWHEEHLMSPVVALLVSKGRVRRPGQVFGFAPHPMFSGKIEPEHAIVMDASVWHSICGQLFGNGIGESP